MTLCDVVLLLIVVSIVFLKALLQIYFLQSFVPNESRIQLKGVSFLSEEKGREEPNRGRNNNKRWEAASLPSFPLQWATRRARSPSPTLDGLEEHCFEQQLLACLLPPLLPGRPGASSCRGLPGHSGRIRAFPPLALCLVVIGGRNKPRIQHCMYSVGAWKCWIFKIYI